MSYARLIHHLFQTNLFSGMKLGLENVQKLQVLLNFPDRSFPSIHIAGTNGKGSVATKIAAGLQAAGYRVGLYTSPHLSCFRERIRINGEMIAENNVERHLSFLFQIVEENTIPATFFELTTFLAFLYFAEQKVDCAVLETGLGGRLDATNVIIPILSVITSISLEHTDLLGDTKEQITQEKAGIIKSGVPVILGPRVPLSPIQERCTLLKAPFLQIKGDFELFELENQAIAKACLHHLQTKWKLEEPHIQEGMRQRPPCRFEIAHSSPLTILDVAHNPDGLSALFKSVYQHFPKRPLRLVFGLSKNKDILSCLTLIAQHGSSFHLIEAPNGRGVSVSILQEQLRQLTIDHSRLFMDKTIQESVRKALQEAKAHNEIVLICGSFFIMNEVRQALNFQDPVDPVDLNERTVFNHLK